MNKLTPLTFQKYGFLLDFGDGAVRAWGEDGVEQNSDRENKRARRWENIKLFLKFSGSLFASYVIYSDLSDFFL
jgi:hypothetical protein